MATSGSYDFSLTADELIQTAWEDLGIIQAGGTVTAADKVLARRRLNLIVKQWQGTADLSPGMKINSRQRVTLFLAKGQQTYLVGPATTDARATTQYGRTTISAAEAIGQTTLSITSNTDALTYPGTTVTMTASDIIGIEQNDGTIHWSTISGTPASTATIADALTVAAAAGNYVWWFTSRAQRFPVIEAAVLRDANRTDTPLTIYKEVEEYELGVTDKYADGTPTAILVEPLRLNTRITLNSQPTDVTDQIVMTVLYPSEDYDATTDDIALPQEGFAALSWELALRCAPAKQVPWTREMEKNYTQAVSVYRNLNPETSVLYFQPGGCE
jgi:hypothetical protein